MKTTIIKPVTASAVPFIGFNSKWPFHTVERFEKEILKQANRIHCVCEPPYAAWKLQKRNEWMINNSEAVIAVWNGSEGGTGNCVTYAKNNSKPIYRINPLTKVVGWER